MFLRCGKCEREAPIRKRVGASFVAWAVVAGWESSGRIEGGVWEDKLDNPR
jgi:hypothetical protein